MVTYRPSDPPRRRLVSPVPVGLIAPPGTPPPTPARGSGSRVAVFSTNERVNAVLLLLPEEAPYYTPADIAPLLNIRPGQFARYCRQVLPEWEGWFRFHTDSQADMAALCRVVRVVLWSGRKLPEGR